MKPELELLIKQRAIRILEIIEEEKDSLLGRKISLIEDKLIDFLEELAEFETENITISHLLTGEYPKEMEEKLGEG